MTWRTAVQDEEHGHKSMETEADVGRTRRKTSEGFRMKTDDVTCLVNVKTPINYKHGQRGETFNDFRRWRLVRGCYLSWLEALNG
ncbi:hypothetical protein QLX08_011410 [Tetragonisca angustula]|uniref:Uncharacterized protein n=1 Tax=Tetragonisca angustula TaxID=166442 RepID=A0AAW0Z817_9HYME